jgi:hypothetical protein
LEGVISGALETPHRVLLRATLDTGSAKLTSTGRSSRLNFSGNPMQAQLAGRKIPIQIDQKENKKLENKAA